MYRDEKVIYQTGDGNNSDELQELQRITDRLEVLEKGRQAKVERLAALYTDQLRQQNHTYQTEEEIMRLSNEVDGDLNEQYALRGRMRNLLEKLADKDGKM